MLMFNKKTLLGVGITVASEKEVLEYIVENLLNSSEKCYIVTPNPELLMIAYRNNDYKKVLNSAKLALPDGVGVLIAGRLMGKGFKEKITGVDLMEKLSKEVAKKPITIGFLGGRGGVAEMTAECLQKKYSGLDVVFVSEEWDGEGFIGNNKLIDILFVAFGSPKQEFWIAENLEKLPIKVAIGVGGAFDFVSGKVRRAPRWVRRIGLEWLFRLIIQPWRIKRQLSLITFVWLALKEGIGIKKPSAS
jgi:N-acetylglucosaminyldiphosphoundecaprenol N-acetyl-beta-D-mannosaminyltransferase